MQQNVFLIMDHVIPPAFRDEFINANTLATTYLVDIEKHFSKNKHAFGKLDFNEVHRQGKY